HTHCDSSASMRTNRLARPHPSRRAYAPSEFAEVFRHTRSSGRGRCKAHHTNSPSRCRGTRWLVRSLYFPVFLQIRNLFHPRSHDLKHTHLLVPAAHLRPSFCILASLTPNLRGGRSAEKRSGAALSTRGACHLASKTRVNALMTRQARRLARRLASHSASRRA